MKPIRAAMVGVLLAWILPGCGGGGGDALPVPPSPEFTAVELQGTDLPAALPPGRSSIFSVQLLISGTPGTKGFATVETRPNILSKMVGTPVKLTSPKEVQRLYFEVGVDSSLPEGAPVEVVVTLTGPTAGPEKTPLPLQVSLARRVGAYEPSVSLTVTNPPEEGFRPAAHVSGQAKLQLQGPEGQSAQVVIASDAPWATHLKVTPDLVPLGKPREVLLTYEFDVPADTPSNTNAGNFTLQATAGAARAETRWWMDLPNYPDFRLSSFSLPAEVGPGTTVQGDLSLWSAWGYSGRVHLEAQTSLPGLIFRPLQEWVDLGPGESKLVAWEATLAPEASFGSGDFTLTGTDGAGVIRRWSQTVATPGAPTVKLESLNLGLHLGPGESRRVPIQVRSIHGFAGKVQLELSGADSGLSCAFETTELNLSPHDIQRAWVQVQVAPNVGPSFSGSLVLRARAGAEALGRLTLSVDGSGGAAIDVEAGQTTFYPTYPAPMSTTLTFRSVHGASNHVRLGGEGLRFDPAEFDCGPDAVVTVQATLAEAKGIWRTTAQDPTFTLWALVQPEGMGPLVLPFVLHPQGCPSVDLTPPASPLAMQQGQPLSSVLELVATHGYAGASAVVNLQPSNPMDLVNQGGSPLIPLSGGLGSVPLQLFDLSGGTAAPGAFVLAGTAAPTGWDQGGSEQEVRIPFTYEVPGTPVFALMPERGVLDVASGGTFLLPVHLRSLGGYAGPVHVALSGPCHWSGPAGPITLGAGEDQTLVFQVQLAPLTPGPTSLKLLAWDGTRSREFEVRLRVGF